MSRRDFRCCIKVKPRWALTSLLAKPRQPNRVSIFGKNVDVSLNTSLALMEIGQKGSKNLKACLCHVAGRPPPSPGKKGQYPPVGHISPITSPFWELKGVLDSLFFPLHAHTESRPKDPVGGSLQNHTLLLTHCTNPRPLIF